MEYNSNPKKGNKIVVFLIVIIVIMCILFTSVIIFLKNDYESKINNAVNTNINNSNENIEESQGAYEPPIIDNKIETIDINKITSTENNLYKSLITKGGYGFYFNDNVNLSDISADRLIPYVLEKYIRDNNFEMNGKYFGECEQDLDVIGDSGVLGEECKNNISKISISKSKIDTYIKKSFNTNRVVTLSSNLKYKNYNKGKIYGYGTGEFIFDIRNNTFYVGLSPKSGVEDYIYRKLIKVEKDDNNIYFYDNAFYCYSASGGYECHTSIDLDDMLFTNLQDREEGKNTKYSEVKKSNSKEVINEEYMFNHYSDRIHTFKHTFRKGNDGNYYWYSSQIV